MNKQLDVIFDIKSNVLTIYYRIPVAKKICLNADNNLSCSSATDILGYKEYIIPYRIAYGMCLYADISDLIEIVVIDESVRECEIEYLDSWFFELKNLKNIVGLENINTSKLISTSGMFYGCSSLQYIDLKLNMSTVQNMSYMFAYCTSLKELDLSSMSNAGLDWWDIPNEQFENGIACMFMGCINLERIYASDKWNSSLFAVSRSGWIFKDCTNLTTPNGDKPDDPEFDGVYAKIGTKDTQGYFWEKE